MGFSDRTICHSMDRFTFFQNRKTTREDPTGKTTGLSDQDIIPRVDGCRGRQIVQFS